jgi:inosose dehydratase
MLGRRHFLKVGLWGSAALAGIPLNLKAASNTAAQGDFFRGLKVGITTYTLRKFSLDQAIALTRQAGVKYISLKDVHLPLKSTREQRQEAHKKIEKAGLTLLGGGVIYLKNDAAEIRRAFDYAKDAGMPTIICSPDPEGLDLVEQLAKVYDIKIAIHNHGPGDQKYPSPLDVLRLVKDRDVRMGICMDIGHTVRIGQDPVAVIKQCASRLYDFHMKDVTSATATGGPTELGKGITDLVGVLRTLLKMKFAYHIALEYEAKEQDPMPGVLESYGYLRGVLAALD